MKWYWVLLIIYIYIAIGAIAAALILNATDDELDATDNELFPLIAIFWPIAIVILILYLPIKIIIDIIT